MSLRPLTLTALMCALLSACTGIDEPPPGLRLVVLNNGGSALGYASSTATGKTALSGQVSVTGGVGVQYLNNGNSFALALASGLEQRDVNLAATSAFTAPPFTPCFKQVVASAARDRLLALSDCSNVQQLALYRSDGTLVWTALLPTPLVTIPGNDTPPTRLAVQSAERAVVSRAALAGGSEVMLVTPRNTGDPLQDAVADVSTPLNTVSIRDLALYGGNVYAATDTGVRALLPSGVPDANASAVQSAFGTQRYDRLWGGSIGSVTLLAAWRSNIVSGASSEYLKLWSGSRTTASNVALLSDLRDLTFGIDGRIYALTNRTLSSYDTVLGLADQVSWAAQNHVTGLSDARALTWVVSGD